MEIYFSVDIETDGPIPGKYSMLSFGVAAFHPMGSLIDTYTANLEMLPDAGQHPDTMNWWKDQPEAWDACRKDTRPPQIVMPEFIKWVSSVGDLCKKSYDKKMKPVFVGYPAGFDFTFMYWYMIEFAGESPFSFSALDIKSYAMAVLGTDFRSTAKRRFPKHWFSKRPHTHIALDDAIEQGELFCNILKERKSSK